ncbi:uncharacterized protein LOC101453599 [Ceratitis capitata]|uniref:(Mediterranean fruit fly) hypothetical protein n=1 Tax=Ceratitis capitata TaxID=7213 RepID=A0A811UKQ8_CERCA|nr:uncharacterized protein LOC101453599 [Ceratitis capitata]CAD6997723.1 unnamed protein product [Ceratitis capitata]
MTKKVVFLVCVIFLQLAFCMLKPQTPNETLDKSIEQNELMVEKAAEIVKDVTLAEKNHILSERKRLIDMIIDGSTGHYVYLLKGTYKIAKDILTDPAVVGTDTVEAQNEKRLLELFINGTAGILKQTSDKCIQLVLRQFFTFANRHTQKRDNRGKEVDIWEDALTRHGMREFEAEENKLLNENGNQYADEFDNYLKSLSPAGRAMEEDLVYVFETYMENKKVMDRVNYGYRCRDALLNSIFI